MKLVRWMIAGSVVAAMSLPHGCAVEDTAESQVENVTAREAGYGQFNNGTYDVLTVRTELDDATKAAVVGEFVGVPGLEIPRINVGETNQYGDVYKAFKQALTIDADKLTLMHNSRWGQHFYGTALLEQMNAKWTPTTV